MPLVNSAFCSTHGDKFHQLHGEGSNGAPSDGSSSSLAAGSRRIHGSDVNDGTNRELKQDDSHQSINDK